MMAKRRRAVKEQPVVGPPAGEIKCPIIVRDGERLTVTLGREKLSPIQYHDFDIGPFTMCVDLKEGDDVEAVGEVMLAALTRIADVEFKARCDRHAKLAEEAKKAVERAKAARR